MVYFIKRVHLKSCAKGFALCAFSCQVTVRTHMRFKIIFLVILSSVSSVKATIEVISGREGTFRVKCTSSGGKTFTMDADGPGYSGEEGQMRVEAVGDPQRIGHTLPLLVSYQEDAMEIHTSVLHQIELLLINRTM